MNRRLTVLAMIGFAFAGVFALAGAVALVVTSSSDSGTELDALVARGPADFDALEPSEIEQALIDAVVGWARLVSVDERDGDNFSMYSAEDVDRWITAELRDWMLQRVAEIDGYNWRTVSDVSVVDDSSISFGRLTTAHIVSLACLDYSLKTWFKGSLETDEQSIEAYLIGFVHTTDGWRVDTAASMGDCD